MLHLNLAEELEATRGASSPEKALQGADENAIDFLESLRIDSYAMGQKRMQMRRMLMQTAYTEEQIRHICIKYRLRCLPEDLFRGQMDVLVPQKKKEFEVDFTEALQEEVHPDNYHILAPSEMFRLTSIDKDPLLLYRFSLKGNYYYKLVHQWGGDLSRSRAIINYPLRSFTHLAVTCLLFWLVFLLALTTNMQISAGSVLTLTSVLLTAATVFSVSLFKSDNGNYQTSDKIWNSDERF